jgi:hypothetical protein
LRGNDRVLDRCAHPRTLTYIMLAAFFRLPDTFFCLRRISQGTTPKSAAVTKSRVFCGFRPGLSIPRWRKGVLAPARGERVNCSGFA